MQIHIVQAIGGGQITLQCEKTDSIASIKEQVAQQKRIPARSVILVFQGKQLDESETLKSAGIDDLDKLYMITRTTGGLLGEVD
jgi:ubiquitin-like protein Nedd8